MRGSEGIMNRIEHSSDSRQDRSVASVAHHTGSRCPASARGERTNSSYSSYTPINPSSDLAAHSGFLCVPPSAMCPHLNSIS